MIVFGEWLHGLVGHKQTGTIKSYILPGLWIIDVYDVNNQTYVPYNEYSVWITPIYPQVVHPLAVLENPAPQEVESYMENHYNLPDDVLAEGIVIKNYGYKNYRVTIK